MAFPPLRNLDIRPIEHEGQTYFCLRDPEGLIDDPALVTPQAFFIAAMLDGKTDAAGIQESFAEQFKGFRVSEEDILRVVEFLDENGYLLSEHYVRLRTAVVHAYREAPVRPAALAGASYPDDEAELRTFIDGLFLREEGPGQIPNGSPGTGESLPCLVVPHIDYNRGGHSYAHGYLRLFQAGKPKTAVVFGVAHAGAPCPFVLTRKDFETPLGTLACDTAFVDNLASACDWDPFDYEILHRNEHSIELQAVMLAYLYGPDVKIVPILCAQFSDDLMLREPRSVKSANTFIERCSALVKAGEGSTTVIAGADLAHVGKCFGDNFEISDEIVAQIERRDREDLRCVTAHEPDDFYGSVMKDGNVRRVCGLNCIYAAMRSASTENGVGDLIHYGYAPDPTGGIVSFAALTLG